MKWNDFYHNRLGESYRKYVEQRYSPFINEIVREMVGKQVVVETGCGIGTITKILHKIVREQDYLVLDNNREMLNLTVKNLGEIVGLKVAQFDIQNKLDRKVDILHSHGVLEHLSIEGIKKCIANQLAICKTLIHYVPSSKYNYKSFGDELLLSANEWRGLVSPDRVIEFNNGYDLILKWN